MFSLGQSLPLSLWILAGAAAVPALLSATAAVTRGRPRLLVALLRMGTVGLLTLLLLRLSVVTGIERVERAPVAVVVDRSLSMTLPALGGAKRWDLVQGFLNDREFWREFQKLVAPEFFTLGEALVPATFEALRKGVTPDASSTRLERGLRALSEDPKWRGIVILSDGVDTEEKPATLSPLPRKVPVVTLHPDPPEGLIDLAVIGARVPEVAYLKNSFSVEVELEAVGFAAAGAAVRVLSGERLLSEARAEAGRWKGEKARLELALTPDRAGPMGLTIEATKFPNEVTFENNQRHVVLNVLRDRVRALHVGGRPSWDVRFLRAYLKENPNIDLVSFFILRSPSDDPEAPEGALSLIPFPYHELFTKELETFDLVLFQNFDFKTYFSEHYLENLAAYVRNGGALVMLGGDLSFGQGGYRGTPVEEVLPVRLLDGPGEIVSSPFRARVSASGRRHPVAADLLSAADLAALPPFWGVHRIGGLQSGAVALLEGSREAEGLPALAVREVGRGRSVAVLVDSLWRWGFSPGPTEAYRGLLNRLYRWLVHDPAYHPVRIEAPREVRAGQPVTISVTARDHRYEPRAGAAVELSLEIPGSPAAVRSLPRTDAAGRTQLHLEPRVPGVLKVEARLPGGGEGYDPPGTVIAVGPVSPEWDRRGVDLSNLSAYAEASGGRTARIADAAEELVEFFSSRATRRTVRRSEEPIWDHPLLWLTLLLSASAEWWYRRRHGGA